jgi:DNA-binding winged helix-turn-helix (wHTH) protein
MRSLHELLQIRLNRYQVARQPERTEYTNDVKRLRFDRFLVDRGRRELLRDGELVHLSPKAFHLLELLIDAAPDAVSRDVLYQGLWPNTFVDDANLPNLVKELRKALEDDSRNPRFIKTLHGFGYAFNEVPRPDGPVGVEWTPFVLKWASREFPLRAGRNVIGRDHSADVCVESAGVSRQHAAITIDSGAAVIADLGSKNGTYVDGAPIEGPVPLSDASIIRLGSASLRLSHISSGDTTMTVSAGHDEDS